MNLQFIDANLEEKESASEPQSKRILSVTTEHSNGDTHIYNLNMLLLLLMI